MPAPTDAPPPVQTMAPPPVPLRNTIQLSLPGLISLCVSLITTTALLLHFLPVMQRPQMAPLSTRPSTDAAPAEVPPWGELVTLEVELDQPEEYVAFESMADRVVVWHFNGLAFGAVRKMMEDCGFTAAQIDHALEPQRAITTAAGTEIRPDDDFVISIPAPVRAKFYGVLSHDPANRYMNQPYCIPRNTFAGLFTKSGVKKEVVELVRKLLVTRGETYFFSDLEVALHKVGSDMERLELFKALTRQTAVLTRVRIRPETDIDKLIGYWGTAPNVRTKDVRPLMESLQRLQEGGTISLLYLLPPFARARLYTSPLPSKPEDVRMDCHWSALNFFNETPDDRYADLEYSSKYIGENFYQIAKPSMYGDLVFLLDAKGAVIHSAVYIADDIVFTKNGVNYAQPWILMRMKNLLSAFTVTEEPRIIYYRRKTL